MKIKTLLLLIITLLAACGEQPKSLLNPGEKIEPFQSFEEPTTWYAVKNSQGTNDSSVSAELSNEHATDGSRSLGCTFFLNGEEGATFKNESPAIRDWTFIEALLFDFNNQTDTHLYVAMALVTSEKFLWQECFPVRIEPGETRNVRYSLKNSFKSELTNWQGLTNIIDRDEVKQMSIKVFGPEATEGTLYIDNIRMITREQTN